MNGGIATPDWLIAVLLGLGLFSLACPWWVQVLWILTVGAVEGWHQLDREYDRAHGGGW